MQDLPEVTVEDVSEEEFATDISKQYVSAPINQPKAGMTTRSIKAKEEHTKRVNINLKKSIEKIKSSCVAKAKSPDRSKRTEVKNTMVGGNVQRTHRNTMIQHSNTKKPIQTRYTLPKQTSFKADKRAV